MCGRGWEWRQRGGEGKGRRWHALGFPHGSGQLTNNKLQYVTLLYVALSCAYHRSMRVAYIPFPSLPFPFPFHHHPPSGVSIQETSHKKRGHNIYDQRTSNAPVHDCAAEETLRLPLPAGRKLDASAILYVGTRRRAGEAGAEPLVRGESVPEWLDLFACGLTSLGGAAGPSTLVAAANGLGLAVATFPSACVCTVSLA